jgi:hypothetical protein
MNSVDFFQELQDRYPDCEIIDEYHNYLTNSVNRISVSSHSKFILITNKIENYVNYVEISENEIDNDKIFYSCHISEKSGVLVQYQTNYDENLFFEQLSTFIIENKIFFNEEDLKIENFLKRVVHEPEKNAGRQYYDNIRTYEQKIEKLQKDIDYYEAKIKQEKELLKNISNTSIVDIEKCIDNFKKYIKTLGSVVYIKNNNLCIETDWVFLKDPVKEETYQIARYKIAFNSIYVLHVSVIEWNPLYDPKTNKNVRNSGIIHPQISRDGNCCLGTLTHPFIDAEEKLILLTQYEQGGMTSTYYNEQLSKTNEKRIKTLKFLTQRMQRGDLVTVVETLLNWISSYTIGDAYIRLTNWLGIENIVCRYCGSTKHLKENCPEAVQCKTCNEYMKKEDLAVHNLEFHNEAGVECFLCGKLFTTDFQLEDHINRHKKECPYCKQQIEYGSYSYHIHDHIRYSDNYKYKIDDVITSISYGIEREENKSKSLLNKMYAKTIELLTNKILEEYKKIDLGKTEQGIKNEQIKILEKYGFKEK